MSLTVPKGDETIALSYLTTVDPPAVPEAPRPDPVAELMGRIEALEARLAKLEKRKR